MRALPLAAIAALVATPSLAGKIKLKKSMATAKSEHIDDSGIDYSASNIADGKASTVWVEGEDGSGLGSWVEIDFGETRTVTALKVWNGNWYTHDFWERHNRIKDMKIEFSDGTTETVVLQDQHAPEVVKLAKPKETSKVRLFVKGIYRGNTFNDTCISEVQIIDDTPDVEVPVKTYAASSTYPADTDGDYEPPNMSDGLGDSMWCEASEGDGTGEWVEFDFGARKEISKLRLINGNGYSFGFNMKSNLALKASLTFDGGSPEQVSLKPSMMSQTVDFGSKTASKVRMTFDEVKAGKEFNDLCISEAAFLK